jgi:6-phosphogluconolactonase
MTSIHRLYVSSSEGSISGYLFDYDTGALVFQNKIMAGCEVSFLCASPDRNYIFATHRDDNVREVASYSINHANGELSLINKISADGARPVHLSIDKTGKFLFQANFNGGNFSLIPVNPDGSLRSSVQTLKLGENPHQIKVDDENKNVYVTHMGSDFIAQYLLDQDEGRLVPNTPDSVCVKKKTGPRHLDFHPNGKWIYVINELNNTITLFGKKNDGTLEEIQSYPTLPGDYLGHNKTADIHVHPGGKYLYGSNRGDNSIAVYSIDQSCGRLELRDIVKTCGDEPRNFAIDPTGNYLLAGNRSSDCIVVFRIDLHDGMLSKCAGPFAHKLPICLLFV